MWVRAAASPVRVTCLTRETPRLALCPRRTCDRSGTPVPLVAHPSAAEGARRFRGNVVVHNGGCDEPGQVDNLRRVRIKAALATATTLAALLSTAACSGSDADPKVLPTLSPTASASPSSTPVVVPAAARARTPQGADAFLRFYFSQLDEAFAASKPQLIRRLSDPACGTCENFARSLEADDEFIRGHSFSDIEVAVPPLTEPGTLAVVTGMVPARQVVDRSGNLIKQLPEGGRFVFEVNVQWHSGHWIVRGIRKAAS